MRPGGIYWAISLPPISSSMPARIGRSMRSGTGRRGVAAEPDAGQRSEQQAAEQ
jgi:hypothetical protein